MDAPYDEAFAPDGAVRPPYAPVLEALARHGPCLAHTGIAVGGGPQARALTVDPTPRVLTFEEWKPLAAGLQQRARLLEALMTALPEAASAHYRERDLEDVELEGPPLAVVGFDVVRRPDGVFALLEENVLTPGHLALPAAREAARLWTRVPTPPLEVAEPLRAALRAALGPDAAILADEPASWELRWLARFLPLRLLSAGDPLPQTVFYRTAEDRLRDDDGELTALGARLLGPLRAGRVRVLNRPGCGVVEDKALFVDGERLLAERLHEPPLLALVPTLSARDALEADPRELVFKPRHGAGGREVVVGPAASAAALAAVRAAVARAPERWIAQRYVPLSVHPTGLGLDKRPVDLRAFAIRRPSGWEVIPGGVSRYPTDPRMPLVNTSAGGGIKDVWILPPARATPPGRPRDDRT